MSDKRNILADLTGGLFSTNKEKQQVQNGNVLATYKVYIQFDDDEPKILHDNVPMAKAFSISFPNPGSPQSYLQFTDNVTGKTMTIFTRT